MIQSLSWPKIFGLGMMVTIGVLLGAWAAALVLLKDAPPPQRVAGGQEATRSPTRRASAALPAARVAVPLAMPVAGMPRGALSDTWGDPRDNGRRAHHGTDIMAAPNTPVIAAAPGTIEKLWLSAAGGTTVYVRSPDRAWIYYYAHLSGYAAGLHEGQAVQAGDPLGYVGDTGNAGAGNYHLHFGLARTAPEQRWYQGEDVNPYPYLAGHGPTAPSLAGMPGNR